MKKICFVLLAFGALTGAGTAQTNGICYVDGITHTTLAQAIACAGHSGTIEVTPSVGTLSVPSSATIPALVTLRVDQGAILSIANAVKLTINGPVQAPGAQIFAYSGTGSVALGGLASEHVIPNWFPGSDMGSQLVNAAAALPENGGVLYPAPGSYRIATAVDFTSSSKAVTVWCAKGVHGNPFGTTPLGAATEFTYSGTGAFFSLNAQTHSGMYGCTLIGPDGNTGETAIGVIVGGGSNNGIFDEFSHNDISGFGNGGLLLGNEVYIAIFEDNVIHDNGPNGGKNILVPPSTLNFGENITFIGGILTNKTAPFSTRCVNIQKSTDMHFVGVSFDHCGLTADALNVDIYLDDNHVENTGGTTPLPFFQFGPNCSFCYLDWRGGYIREDTPSARVDFFEDNSTVSNVNNQISITSGIMVPSQNTPQLVLINHPCCDQVSVGPIQNGQGGYTFTSMVGGTPIGSIAVSPINGIEVYKTSVGIYGRQGASELGVDPTTQRWVMNNGNNGTEFIAGSFHQLITPFAPTISANGCGGSGASIATNNGPASFTVNVGTAPTQSCTFTLPIPAATGWNCTASDLTTSSTNVFLQKQTATNTSTATITNFNDVAVASHFVTGDILAVSCFAR